jgi:hypothetical protein
VYAIIYSPGGRLSPGLSFTGGRLPFVRKSSSVDFFGLGVGVAFLVALGFGLGEGVAFFFMPGIITCHRIVRAWQASS